MSLRDDLVNQQKEQSQKNREKAKEEKALSLQREQNYKQQKAQLQKQKEDAFDAFARQVKEGHVPDEWVKLYDGYVEKIKEHILKGNLSFHFKDAVSADYYQEKASVNKGKKQRRYSHERLPYKTPQTGRFFLGKIPPCGRNYLLRHGSGLRRPTGKAGNKRRQGAGRLR